MLFTACTIIRLLSTLVFFRYGLATLSAESASDGHLIVGHRAVSSGCLYLLSLSLVYLVIAQSTSTLGNFIEAKAQWGDLT